MGLAEHAGDVEDRQGDQHQDYHLAELLLRSAPEEIGACPDACSKDRKGQKDAR